MVNFYEFIWLINKNVFLRIDFTIFIPHPQMYDNIKSLRLVKEGAHTIVTAMISSEGEVMEFRVFSKYTPSPTPAPNPSPNQPASGQSPYALIANFKIELFYGSALCSGWLAGWLTNFF